MSIRTFFLGTAFAITLHAGTAGSALAQSRIYEAGAFVGISRSLSNPPPRVAVFRDASEHLVVRNAEFEEAFTAGVHSGVRFADRYGVALMLSWTPTRMLATHGLADRNGAVDVNTLSYGVMFHHHWPNYARFQPFAGIGLGAETALYEPEGWNSRTDFVASLSAGADVQVRDGLALRFSARHNVTAFESMIDGEDDRLQNQLVFSLGLNLAQAR